MNGQIHPNRLQLSQIHAVAHQYAEKLGTAVATNAAGCRPEQAADDLKNVLQSAISGGRPLVYLYASHRVGVLSAKGINQGEGHVDTFVATPNGRLLNLVGYDSPSDGMICMHLAKNHIPIATMDLTSWVRDQRNGGLKVNPQGDMTSCGSLGLSFMKEYLKDDARQLASHCLVVRSGGVGVDGWASADQLIPSPQVLRYSQSSLAVKVARAVVEGTENSNTVEHNGKTVQVQTLVGRLRSGVRCERAFDAPGSGPGLDESALAAFREQWCRAFDEALPKREAMNGVRDGKPQNVYLSHVVDRHARKAPEGGP